MPNINITFTIPEALIPEVKAAIDYHTSGETSEFTDAQYRTWAVDRSRDTLRTIVRKYRLSQRPAVDTTDPTSN